MFLRNASIYLQVHMALQLRTLASLFSPPRKPEISRVSHLLFFDRYLLQSAYI
jgi:hypothetical protein